MNRPHYDSISHVYASARQSSVANSCYYDFWSQTMLDQVPEGIDHARCLDCMAGSCEMSRVARLRVGEYHATDVSMGILRLSEPGTYTRTCADARCLPYKANSFDLVLIRGGLHHIHNTIGQALRETYRVLKPGGWLICVEPADDNPLIRNLRETLHRVSSLYEEGERGFRRRKLQAALHETGFTDIAISPFGFLGYTLIGNTDVFPLLGKLRNQFLIDTLIAFDRLSPGIPGWRLFGLTHLARARALK